MLRGRFRTVVATLAAVLVVGGTLIVYAAVPEGATYVGVSKCRMCHLTEHKTWQASKHSSNFDVLIGDERSNPDCLKCHTTGYGKPGGFVDMESTPGMTSVGCEACHGPGSAHVAAAGKNIGKTDWEKMINKIPQNTCVQCHNPHVSQKARAEEMRKAAQ